MAVKSLRIGAYLYSVMENPTKTPKTKSWMAVCPMKGNDIWYGSTEKKLISVLEEMGGGVAQVEVKTARVIWQSSAMHGGKPIVTWKSDGVMDVDTPTARFRLEVTLNNDDGPVDFSGFSSGAESLIDFSYQLQEYFNAEDYCFLTTLTKVRIKNRDGTTLRDIVVEDVSCDSDDAPYSSSVIGDYLGEFSDNPLVEFVLNGGEGDATVEGISALSQEERADAINVFRMAESLVFMDCNCQDDEFTGTENSYEDGSLGTDKVEAAVLVLTSAAEALRGVL